MPASLREIMASVRWLDDLDWEKVKSYATSLSGMGETTPEKILIKRGCLTEQDGKLKPTYAGILLFGKDPQRFVRGADITAARFATETMSDTFIRQDMSGTLPDQIRRAETFLVDHLRKGDLLGKSPQQFFREIHQIVVILIRLVA